MGFGNSVVQRLVKTSIKKNLYWEIKDKVIEENFDGFRTQKKSAKVKVYGTDSNKTLRPRLIEILYDRVALHKDKFIAPLLHHELESMEVKKSGKVEHADNAHDDQIFSYLMALYVWYDGIDLMERYGIRKNTIKTDEDVDIEELTVTSDGAGLETVDVDAMVRDMDQDDLEVDQQLKYVAQSMSFGKSMKDFNKMQADADKECLDNLLATDKVARRAYSKKYHIDLDDKNFNNMGSCTGYVSLPDDLFGNINVEDDYKPRDNIMGSLADMWRNLIG